MGTNSRRDFIKKTGLATGVLPFVNNSLFGFTMSNSEAPLEVHMFSKQLQFLDYKNAGQVASELGFSGLDLTVRPGGHVEPKSVKKDLARAVSEIEKGGSSCKLMTTSIESVNNVLDVDVLNAASELGIKYYRTNWYKYFKDKTIPESISFYQEELRKLGVLNEELGLIGCYQNHSGTKVGASFWEIYEILKKVNPEYFGTQYDIRHAMVEGGYSWVNGLELLRSQMKVIVLKDFKWAKINGKWKVINVPIGEGMVDFDKYFKLLKEYKLNPPVSLHLEYDLGGAEHGDRSIKVDPKVVFDAMKKDLTRVQQLWENA